MERAVFLDRDGTIIEDIGYPHERSIIKFLPRVSKAVRLLNESGFKVIIITNQAGVARGYFTEDTVKEINKYIQETLTKERAFIDMIYYCPHHIDGIIEKYRKDCYCRKPNPGMIEQAAREFGIDLEKSFVIGDKSSDIEAGRRAGCRTVLLTTENPSLNDKGTIVISDYTAPDLYEAVKWLVKPVSKKRGC
ncbi:D-glycero-alpha-D-manno-heptose-1,7-bisphosphate 7-phosphatase [Chloroflexota bacterium]